MQNSESSKHNVNLRMDLRYVVVILLLAIAAMLIVWKPWSQPPTANNQVITVSGEAELTDTPDEYVFYPAYQFKNTDKEAGLAEVEKKSNEVVAGLKKLGVNDNKIKTGSSAYDQPSFRATETEEANYSLQLTVTVNDKKLAQKVQDYLITTTPTGAVSPQSAFSDDKRKSLEKKARDAATKDARAKADQMAENLGFKVGKVKAVSDGQQFGIPRTMEAQTMAVASDTAVSSSGLSLQPGENELNYTVEVTYYIR